VTVEAIPRQQRRGRGGRPETYAALDLGTNNCRLLVARPARDGFRVIDAFSRIVRLGEGLAANGHLSGPAIERTIDALGICAAKMRRRGVTRARNVATEACRQARNCGDFLDRVRERTGIELEIISTDEEARLALEGCLPLFDSGLRHALMFDIGGGSTELLWIGNPLDGAPEIIESVSLPCGVVGFAERYGGRDVSSSTYESMVGEVLAMLSPLEARHGIATRVGNGEVQMLGTSGTVTTLAGIHMELPRYDRARVDGCRLTFDDANRVARRLIRMDYDGRVAHPCIGPDRADMVIAGTAIFEAICRLWPVGHLRVADRGLREGILLGLMRRTRSAPHAAE
jgi:exopolyphosphatase/guanosine-5'-triphosphate,3'-diphosphate pyrophosphatase